MFGAGIGLGSVLLKTKAATWLAQVFVNAFSLETASVFLLIAIMAAFLILIHLGFASATALSSAHDSYRNIHRYGTFRRRT